MRHLLTGLTLCSLMIFPARAEDGPEAPAPQNVVAFENGAVLLNYTSEYGGRSSSQWIALNLIDGLPEMGWASKEGLPHPNEFVFELKALAEISAFTFDTSQTEERSYPGIAARAVTVEGSMTGAEDGYRPLYSGPIGEVGENRIELDMPVQARWLKLTITGNGGDARYSELMEFGALGQFVVQTAPQQQEAATYKTNWNAFYMLVEGNELRGCYDHDGGQFSGFLQDHFINIEWAENDGTQRGKAIIALTESGSAFSGYWYEDGILRGTWIGTRDEAANPPSCTKNLLQAGNNAVAESLDQSGRAVLYGIYFDTDSDVLKPDSQPTLNNLKAWLTKNPEASIALSGHTDSDGAEAYNQDLSQRRAQAVVTWLSSNGITTERLTAKGLGETQPVADNGSAQGKALNRRVEVEIRG